MGTRGQGHKTRKTRSLSNKEIESFLENEMENASDIKLNNKNEINISNTIALSEPTEKSESLSSSITQVEKNDNISSKNDGEPMQIESANVVRDTSEVENEKTKQSKAKRGRKRKEISPIKNELNQGV